LYSAYGPAYGDGWLDIYVSDHCNASKKRSTCIGTRLCICTYANDTAFEYFFTGAEYFTVKEIETFEIAD
jgi:hypothetical protein